MFKATLLVLLALIAPVWTLSASAASFEILPSGSGVQPQLAASPNGTFHMVFGRGDAVFYSGSSDGKAFTTPVKVGEVEKLALGRRRGPRIAATDGVIAITAISHPDGMIHSWTSSDAGKTWRAGAAVNGSPASAREGLHAMAGDGKGAVAVAWLDSRSGKNQLWSRVSKDGGVTWQPETKVYESPDGHICECCHPSVAIGPKGEISAMWRNWLGGARDMWVATSTDGGKTFGEAGKLGTGTWKLNACPMDGGSMAYLGNGSLAAVFRRELLVIAAKQSDRTESALAPMAAQPVMATRQGGSPVYVWQQGGTIQLQDGRQHRSLGTGEFPAIVAAPNGASVLVAWQGEGESIQGELLPPP